MEFTTDGPYHEVFICIYFHFFTTDGPYHEALICIVEISLLGETYFVSCGGPKYALGHRKHLRSRSRATHRCFLWKTNKLHTFIMIAMHQNELVLAVLQVS